MVRLIWLELRNFRAEAETVYGSDKPAEMVGQYLWGTLQEHLVMGDFLWTQFHQHPEVDPHITLYLFGHVFPQVEVSALKNIVEAQSKTLNQIYKTCKELRDRVDVLMKKSNRLSNK